MDHLPIRKNNLLEHIVSFIIKIDIIFYKLYGIITPDKQL